MKYNYQEVKDNLEDIINNPYVRQLKNYVHHGQTSIYKHSKRVTVLAYKINEFLSLHCDLKTLLTSAMLHDFYLYDWHKLGDGTHRLHGFKHAKTSSKNAAKFFGVDKKTQDIISSHMWPLNITKVPKSKEAWVVWLADKMVSVKEIIFGRCN